MRPRLPFGLPRTLRACCYILLQAAGWWGIFTSALAFYIGLGILFEEMWGREVRHNLAGGAGCLPVLCACLPAPCACCLAACLPCLPTAAFLKGQHCLAPPWPMGSGRRGVLFELLFPPSLLQVLPMFYTKLYKKHAKMLFPRVSEHDPMALSAGVPYEGRPGECMLGLQVLAGGCCQRRLVRVVGCRVATRCGRPVLRPPETAR